MQKIDVPNSLIGMSHIDETICDDLIDFYKKDKMFPAWEGVSAGQKIQKDIKESFDKSLVISLQHPAIIKYIECLQDCINGYAELYPTLYDILKYSRRWWRNSICFTRSNNKSKKR